jgi:hypothetical protein
MKALSLADYIVYTRGDEEGGLGGSEGNREVDRRSVISKRPKADKERGKWRSIVNPSQEGSPTPWSVLAGR